MRQLSVSAMALGVALGAAAPVMAQPFPPTSADPAMSYTIVGVIPNGLSDTRRNSIAATPDCGPANPQGGIPTSTTWGSCP